MNKLFLLRHLKSQWNSDNRFTGWVDIPVSKEGSEQAREIAEKIKDTNFDVIYTSPLIRNKQTIIKVLRNIGGKYPMFKYFEGKMKKLANFEGDGNYIPAYISEKLNERYYGKLQGLDKTELAKKYGDEQLQLWRRSYTVAPPGGESGKDVYKRVVPFFKKYAEKDLKEGKNVLVVASHNSLRIIMKYLEKISDSDFGNMDLGFGALVEYDFDGRNYSRLQ